MELLQKKSFALLITAASIFASMLLVGASFGASVLIAVIVSAVFFGIDTALVKLPSSSQKVAVSVAIAAVAVIALCVVGGVFGAHDTEVSPSSPVQAAPNNTPASEESSEPPRDEAYELGLAYYEAGKYQDAIETLRKVSEGSAFYVDAQKMLLNAIDGYRSGLVDSTQPYVESGNYSVAINILKEGLSIVSDDAELTRLIDEYSSAYAAEVRTAAVESASASAAEGDYAAAITSLCAAIEEIGEDAELTALKNDYSDKYREELVTQATVLLEANNYYGGLELLRNGQSVLPNDEGLNSAIADYEKHKPVYLCEDIDCLRMSDRIYYTYDSMTDNKGNEYTGHLIFYSGYASYTYDKYSILFDTSAQYTKFCGTTFLPYEFRGSGRCAYIYIYGDDRLLFQTEPMSMGYISESFSLDITGVETIKVEFKPSEPSLNWEVVDIYGCLTNAYFSK